MAEPDRPGFRLRVQNFRGLRQASWAPEGVCALVGPNGTGKSTLLEGFNFVHYALKRSPKDAILATGGTQAFVHHTPVLDNAGDDPSLAQVRFTVESAEVAWTLSFSATNDNIAPKYEESLRLESGGDEQDTLRSPPTDIATRPLLVASGRPVSPGGLLPPEAMSTGVGSLRRWLSGIAVYRPWELTQLRKQPWSDPGLDDLVLRSDGANLFVVLQNWRDDRKHAWRFEWVMDHLKRIHGRSIDWLELKKGGGVLGAQYYAPGSDIPLPIKSASNGVLGTLLSLTAAAGGHEGDIVLIDEPDNGLHPSAIRALVLALRGLHDEHEIHVVLATHSSVLLNTFSDRPEDVWVTERKEGQDFPVRLTDLCEPEWLANFRLGNLYGSGFGRQDVLSGGGE